MMPRTPAGRLSWLLDLHAPPMYDDDGEFIGRDETGGLISREQLLELLEMVPAYAASSGSSGSRSKK